MIPWIAMVTYQTYVLACVSCILKSNDGNVNIDQDMYTILPKVSCCFEFRLGQLHIFVHHRKAALKLNWTRILALCTLQNVLGWSRTRFYPKLYLLSDLVLHALAFFGAKLVGRKAIAGGFVLIDRLRTNELLYGEVLDPKPRHDFEEGP